MRQPSRRQARTEPLPVGLQPQVVAPTAALPEEMTATIMAFLTDASTVVRDTDWPETLARACQRVRLVVAGPGRLAAPGALSPVFALTTPKVSLAALAYADPEYRERMFWDEFARLATFADLHRDEREAAVLPWLRVRARGAQGRLVADLHRVHPRVEERGLILMDVFCVRLNLGALHDEGAPEISERYTQICALVGEHQNRLREWVRGQLYNADVAQQEAAREDQELAVRQRDAVAYAEALNSAWGGRSR